MVSKRQLPQEEIEKAVSDPGVFLQTVIEAGASLHASRGRAPDPACLGRIRSCAGHRQPQQVGVVAEQRTVTRQQAEAVLGEALKGGFIDM